MDAPPRHRLACPAATAMAALIQAAPVPKLSLD